jgi:hypothetical protein
VAIADIFELFEPNLDFIDKLPYSPQYKTRRNSVQCKHRSYMSTDGQTSRLKEVYLFPVCANAPKVAVIKQSHSSWKHASWLHEFPNRLSLSGTSDTLADLISVNKEC